MVEYIEWAINITDAVNSTALMGLCRKNMKSPPDISNARRRFSSISGPSIKPKTKGAAGNLRSIMIYPIAPKAAVIKISNALFLRLYEPKQINRIIAG